MKKRILLILLVSVMLLSLLAAMVACGEEETPEPLPVPPGLTPDYPAPPIEEGAEDIGGENGEKLEAPEGGSAVGLIYQTAVTVDLSDKKVTLDFRNPQKSLQNMSLQLIVQDQVLAESGLLTPGKRLSTLTLEDGVTVPVGYYATNAKFLIRYFDPETNTCAIINTEIAVKVTVQE